jgi:hypothetical protein
MSLFRTAKHKTLPSASDSLKQTKRRRAIDWQLNPDPVDGQVRQGTKDEKMMRDTNHRPLLLVNDLCILIKGNASQ